MSPAAPPGRRQFIATLGAIAVSTLGCGGGTDPSRPRLQSRPGIPTLQPTIGASAIGIGTGRDGLLYVPAGYDAAVPAPLLVALHGAGGSSGGWASYHARADARGMVLLAPDSRDVTWDLLNGTIGPDAAFIDQALAHTFARCRIDPARICLAGFSDGATYSLALGLANGDLFSNLIAYSPGFLALPDERVGRPRVFDSHGTADTVLPVSSSRDVVVPGLRSLGYDVTYREFAGGHMVPADVTEEALDWFL